MKVLYVARIPSLKGVNKKVNAQISCLKEVGVDVHGLLISDSKERTNLQEAQDFDVLYLGSKKDRVAKQVYQFIMEYINKHKDIQLVYFRYPFASRDFVRLLKDAKVKFLLEHNTKEIPELLTFFKTFSLRDAVYSVRHLFFSNIILNGLKLVNEMWFGPSALKLASCGIAVTPEIADYETKRLPGYKTFVVGNGIEVESHPVRTPPLFDGKKLSMILVSGHLNNWHGVDRLLRGMAIYTGKVTFELHLVGLFKKDIRTLCQSLNLQDCVSFHPILDAGGVAKLFSKVHIGLGHLAFFRKNMNEGTVLKVREYIASGLPYIISHKEVDIESHQEFSPFYLKVPHDESPIDMSQLVEFTEKVYSIQDHPQQMRKLALKYIDMKVKMRQLADVFKKM